MKRLVFLRYLLTGGAGAALGYQAKDSDMPGFTGVQQFVKGLVDGRPFGWFTPQMYGAKGDGTTDDTDAVQRAIDAAGAVNGVVSFPDGTYLVTGAGITISTHRTRLRGVGKRGAEIRFAPTAHDQAAITVSGGAAVLYQAGIEDGITLYSSDTTFRKVGLRLVDTSEFDLDGLTIGPTGQWTDTSNGSIGIQLRGRELTTIRRPSISADIPISIEANPNSALIACDHLHIEDSYLIASGVNPCIKVAQSAPVTNLLVDGSNAWATGGYGLFWDDPVGTYHQGVTISNVRWEQSTNATGYAIYITAPVRGLKLDNVWCGNAADHRGIYLRRAKNVRICGGGYAGTGEALNIDAGSEEIARENHFVQAGATISLGTMQEVWSTPQLNGSGVPDTAVYRDPAMDSVPGVRLYGQQEWAKSVSLAHGASIDLPWSGSLSLGRLEIEVHSTTYFEAADVLVRSAGAAVVKLVSQTAGNVFGNTNGGALGHVYVWPEGTTVHVLNYLNETADLRLKLRYS